MKNIYIKVYIGFIFLKKIIIPIPSTDFDPTEVGIPWISSNSPELAVSEPGTAELGSG